MEKTAEKTKILLPKLGESILGAIIVRWFKQEGDHVREDEPLLEVSTDKVTSEIPSPLSGYITSIFAKNDEYVEVGKVLAEVEHEDKKNDDKNTWRSPAVKGLIEKMKISEDEIARCKGSGYEQRMTKKDLETFLLDQKTKTSQDSVGIEKIKMSPLRKAIAEQMIKSSTTIPHATLLQEVDITHILKLIAAHKNGFYEKTSIKLTISSLIAQVISQTVLEFPLLNATVEEDYIIKNPDIHLGVAVSVEQGVIVPVIRQCQLLSLKEIAKQLSDLSKKAREQTLSREETQQGSITMTNFGMGGALIGIPIIKYPQVAIIGIGAMTKKVDVIDGDKMAIRDKMFFSLTFDHRVVDGMYGCEFLRKIQSRIENYSEKEMK